MDVEGLGAKVVGIGVGVGIEVGIGVGVKIGIESGMVIGGEAESADMWVEFRLSAGRKKFAGSVWTDRCGKVSLIQFMVFGQS